jgi:hypothetical protein
VLRGKNTADATAFIDSVGISTSRGWAFGLWDQGLGSGALRSDFASDGVNLIGVPDALGGIVQGAPCIFNSTSLSNGLISGFVGAGATPAGNNAPNECYGYSTGPYPVGNPNANWFSSGVAANRLHWLAGINNEFVANTFNSGAPNQSAPNVSPGAAGSSILSLFSGADTGSMAPPNQKLGHIIFNTNVGNPSYKLPYASFGVNSVRGNGKPLAIADAGGAFRPKLSFKSAIMDSNFQDFGSWFGITTSGWSDGIPRSLLVLDFESVTNLGGTLLPSSGLNLGWNWNIVNSYYYPGAAIAYLSAQQVSSQCPGVTIPMLPRQRLFREGLSAIRQSNVDIYGLISCAATTFNAWGNPSLPDQIIARHLEWSLEVVDYYAQNAAWKAVSDIKFSKIPGAFVDAGFEAPVVTSFQYSPVGSNWNFNSGAGIQRNASPWGATNALEGVQTAFLQGASAAVSQTVQLEVGTYAIAFLAARRANQIQPILVLVNGVPVGTTITPSSNSFLGYTSSNFTVPAGTHAIELRGTVGGDNSSFVDAVSIVQS